MCLFSEIQIPHLNVLFKLHLKPNIKLAYFDFQLFLGGGLLPHSAYVSLKQAFILLDSFVT